MSRLWANVQSDRVTVRHIGTLQQPDTLQMHLLRHKEKARIAAGFLITNRRVHLRSHLRRVHLRSHLHRGPRQSLD